MNPNVVRLANAVSNVCKVLGLIIATNGALATKYATVAFYLQVIGGGAMVVIPAFYDVWAAGRDVIKSLAVGAQAGINLALSGEAVDKEGNKISAMSPEATPFLPVTEAAGVAIAAKYGPAPADVPKA